MVHGSIKLKLNSGIVLQYKQQVWFLLQIRKYFLSIWTNTFQDVFNCIKQWKRQICRKGNYVGQAHCLPLEMGGIIECGHKMNLEMQYKIGPSFRLAFFPFWRFSTKSQWGKMQRKSGPRLLIIITFLVSTQENKDLKKYYETGINVTETKNISHFMQNWLV